MLRFFSCLLALCLLFEGGCSPSSPPAPVASSISITVTSPTPPAKPVIALKPSKTPEAEASEVTKKFKTAGFWTASGMADIGKQNLIQDFYVGNNGTLQMGLCDWFWTLGAEQQKEWLEQMQRLWAEVHSPGTVCKSRLSCWIPDMNNQNSIPAKVGCRGINAGELKRISDETRGRISKRKLERYQTEEFAELKSHK